MDPERDDDDDLLDFIKTYLRQIAETGMPVEEPEVGGPVYRVDERAADLYVLLREIPDGGGAVEEAVFDDRQAAYLAAAMLTALGDEADSVDPEAMAEVEENPDTVGPAQKAYLARAFRGLIRNPAAIELFIEGVGEREVLERAYASALERMQEGEEN